jgi:hypothetical protein
MKLEDQVCSLELAKKLKELGVKQESLFWYTCFNDGTTDIHFQYDRKYVPPAHYSAFTVAELGALLPKSIFIKTEDEEKKIFSNFRLVTGRNIIVEEEKPVEVWTINYICDTTNQFRNWLFDAMLTKNIYDVNEANTRAKMLIYLIENKLINLE